MNQRQPVQAKDCRKVSKRKFCWMLLLVCIPCTYVYLWFSIPTSFDVDRNNVHQTGFQIVEDFITQAVEDQNFNLEKTTKELFGLMSELFSLANCTKDATILKAPTTKENILIAANFFNCQTMMPNFIIQVLQFVNLHRQEQIRVSVYESGSTDLTPLWLKVLQRLLIAANIRNQIAVHGSVNREAAVDRIEFLAQLRNAAIAPLQDWRAEQNSWTAQRVLFVNDVFFCTADMLRLLLHHEEDIVCGMDFSTCVGCLPRSFQRELMCKDFQQRSLLPGFLIAYLLSVKRFLRIWRRSLTVEDHFRLDVPLVFYDRWVTTDLNGVNFENAPPYILQDYSASLLQQGYPVYVHSCWNGMSLLRTEPLYQNLKFRAQFKEECQASECFFLCHDYAALGFDKILLDPGIRTGYYYDEYSMVYNPHKVLNLTFVPWDSEIIYKRHMQPRPHPQQITCCVLSDGLHVDFDKDCHTFDYSKLNCSLRAMGQTETCYRV